jgi:peptidoglycan hydrolase-like protein with peptidoglycan-binding domain
MHYLLSSAVSYQGGGAARGSGIQSVEEDGMRNSKFVYFVAGALVALLSSTATYYVTARPGTRSPPAGKSTSHVLLSPEDYIEIQQLMSFYARDVDPGSVQDASWLFTKDAVAAMGPSPIKTAEEFKKFYTGVKDGTFGGGNLGGVRHFNSSYVIVGTPDGGARGSSYMLQVERRTDGGPVEVTLFGKYEDKYVKTPDGWRIKERVWTADTFRNSKQQVTPSPVPNDPSTYGTGIDQILANAKVQGSEQAR